ncbi:hypothetical protein [Crossiella sp. CA198]|uniref:hypothetical protein n=1 Tax=Crossiella sp. CA198 TaxID=3455607 RepID=UPI003F8D4EF3
MAIGGFNGNDPAPTEAQLQDYVHSGQLRFVWTSGESTAPVRRRHRHRHDRGQPGPVLGHRQLCAGPRHHPTPRLPHPLTSPHPPSWPNSYATVAQPGVRVGPSRRSRAGYTANRTS